MHRAGEEPHHSRRWSSNNLPSMGTLSVTGRMAMAPRQRRVAKRAPFLYLSHAVYRLTASSPRFQYESTTRAEASMRRFLLLVMALMDAVLLMAATLPPKGPKEGGKIKEKAPRTR